jgi:hypothetical protein
MDIPQNFLNKLEDLLKIKNKSSDKYELEFRLYRVNSDDKRIFHISQDKFINTIQRLTFDKTNGGFAMNYEVKHTLEITSDEDDIRLIVSGEDNIKKLWLHNSYDIQTSFIIKKRSEVIDLSEYNVRLALNEEETVEYDALESEKNVTNIMSNDAEKTFRYKKRYSVFPASKDIRFDLTMTKMSVGADIVESNVFKSITIYEIEMEYIGNDGKSMDILKNLSTLLMLVEDNNILLTTDIKQNIIDTYLETIGKYTENNLGRGLTAYEDDVRSKFIAVNPITLHRKNIMSNKNVQNIIDTEYAVTPKADGTRNLLVVHNGGEMYRFNINFDISAFGFIASNWDGTIIEGEYVDDKDIFLSYDMLFYKGEDIRSRHLIYNKTERGKGNKGRHELLNEFISSKFTKTFENASTEIIMKDFEYSSGGNSIYEKSKKLWESRMRYDYKIDGLIYIPIKEYYPTRIGAWHSLFKWKPTELNTIDFLIKIERDERGNELIRSLYDENTSIRYKTVELYVGSQQDMYNKNSKSYKKNTVPILFSPFQSNEKSSKVNTAKVKLDMYGKMIAVDPVHNILQEIMDDVIVEFAYNVNDKNFGWKPIRVRYDKTLNYKNGQSVFGNNEKTANDIWRNIHMPITSSMLFDGSINDSNITNARASDVPSLQNNNSVIISESDKSSVAFFHHMIKKDFHERYADDFKEEKIEYLDMGSGTGNDLSIWRDNKYNRIVGLDKNKLFIETAINTYKSVPKPKPSVFYVVSDLTKLIFPGYNAGYDDAAKGRLQEYMPSKNIFHMVGSFFTISEIYDSELSIKVFCQNMADSIKQDGYLMLCNLDGAIVFDKLKAEKTISGGQLWRIEKKYRISAWDSDKHMSGKKINVMMTDSDVMREQYLVNFEHIEKILADYGFEKMEDIPFPELYNEIKDTLEEEDQERMKLSNDEEEYSFMFRFQTYKKSGLSPNGILKDVVKRAGRRKV